MIDRCLNRNNQNFHNYGGRGITVCLHWIRNRESFIEWALSNGYADNLTIDRIDVNDGYYPENCRWATVQQQAHNKRNTKYVTYEGATLSVFEWCNRLNLDYPLVYQRLFHCGWTIEDAFNPDIEFKPRPYLYQGQEISPKERHQLLSIYKKIIDENYCFMDAPPATKGKQERISELAKMINERVRFFEIDAERVIKISNTAA